MEIDITAWYEKYGPMVIRRCRKILKSEEDALDAAHDVFENIIKASNRLHGQFPSSLLYTTATNICLNKLRKMKKETLNDFSTDFFDGKVQFYEDDGFNKIDAQMLLDVILKDESQENRAICFMYHADGMTYKEIGEAVGLSIAGVRKRLESFKSRLKNKLEDI